MTPAASRKPSLSIGARAVLGGAALLVAAACVPAGAAESTTGVSSTPPIQRGTTGRQLWRISDYTTVELVAREPGAAASQHPHQVEQNTLHALLQQVQTVRSGAAKPLFAIDELNAIVPPLTEALANARADQDVALVSAARHEDNTFYGITAVTARLFVVDGHLNLIVRDARLDFYDTARGSGMAPHFTVGSRTAPGTSAIQSASATNQRADWLVLANASTPPVAPAAVVAPVAPMAPVAPAAPMAPAAVVAPAAPVAVPAPVVTPAPVAPAAPAAAPVGDAEQRLTQLKRLYDKGLITKSEYEKKRQEIIKGL
ncbi:MAG: SHOCT domain-containing protein [Betaproteobacteria bacterium]